MRSGRQVTIAGDGLTNFGKGPRTVIDLACEAAATALERSDRAAADLDIQSARATRDVALGLTDALALAPAQISRR